jgi:outer membrane receptor protein involved in Fe transport
MQRQLPIILIVIFSLYMPGTAQLNMLDGHVFDEATGKPLKKADVYLSESGAGSLTDEVGYFQISNKNISSDDSLIVSYLGYEDKHIPVKSFKNGSDIFLKPVSLNMDEIVISADKIDLLKHDIPQQKKTIDFKEIEHYGSNELSDVLKPLPSVRIEGNDLDGRKIQIRGSDADEVNVYLDGVLLNNVGFDDAADLSIIPLEAIESIEVVNGGNSAFLGNGAFGGVVNMTTRRPGEQTLSMKTKLSDQNSWNLLGDFAVPFGRKFWLGYFGQYNSFRPEIEYFKDELYSDKTTNAQINTTRQNHILNLNYLLPAGYMNAQFIGYLLHYDKPNWTSEYATYSFAASYRGELLKMKNVDFLVNQLFAQDKIIRAPSGNEKYINQYKSNQLNIRLSKKFNHKGGEIQLFSEYYHDGLSSISGVEDLGWSSTLFRGDSYDNRISFAGVTSFYDNLTQVPGLSWKTYLGLRGDLLGSNHKDIIPMVGAILDYNYHEWIFSAYANYGKNVKYPSLQKNGYLRDLLSVLPTDTSFSPLKPEYSNSAELGIGSRYQPQQTFFREGEIKVSVFTRSIYNKLITRPFDDMVALPETGRSLVSGLEGSLEVKEIFDRLALGVAAIKMKISNPLLYAYKPRENFSTHLSWTAPYGAYFLATFFYEGESIAWYYDMENNFRTETINPFYDMDISVGWNIPVMKHQLELQFSGYNIFDNAGFKYYYLKKKYLQVSLGIRY